MSAPDEFEMIVVDGIRYRPEDAKRLGLVATPEPIVGATQDDSSTGDKPKVEKPTAKPAAKKAPAKKAPAKKAGAAVTTKAAKPPANKSVKPANKADEPDGDKGTA